MPAENIENVANTIQIQMVSIANLIEPMIYIAAIGTVMTGLIAFKKYSENPERTTLSQAMARLVIGLMLLTLPSAMGAVFSSMIDPAASRQSDKAAQGETKNQKIQEQVQKQELAAKAEADEMAKAAAEAPKQLAPSPVDLVGGKLIKEPKRGGAGDLSALAEVLAAFAAFALLAWYAIKKAEIKNKQNHAQIVDLALEQIQRPSEKNDGV